MHSVIRRFIKTGIVFLILGLLLGLWMLVRRELFGAWPSPYLTQRARIAAHLGDAAEAATLVRDAFAEGLRRPRHAGVHVRELSGDPTIQALFRPQEWPLPLAPAGPRPRALLVSCCRLPKRPRP